MFMFCFGAWPGKGAERCVMCTYMYMCTNVKEIVTHVV